MMVSAERICGSVMAGSAKRWFSPERSMAYQNTMLTPMAPDRCLTSATSMNPTQAA
jgi:hypothetical protein